MFFNRIPQIFKRKQRIVSVNTKLNKNLQLTTLQVAKDDISELLSPRDRLTTEDTENPAKSLPYLRSKIGWSWGEGGKTNLILGSDKLDTTAYYFLFWEIICFKL